MLRARGRASAVARLLDDRGPRRATRTRLGVLRDDAEVVRDRAGARGRARAAGGRADPGLCAATVASSDAVGSSARSSCGAGGQRRSRGSARCRRPPESRCGYSSSPPPGSGNATSASASTAPPRAPRRARRVRLEPDRLRRSARRSCAPDRAPSAGSWNTRPISRPRTARQLAARTSAESVAAARRRRCRRPARRRARGPRIARASCVFPLPLSPDDRERPRRGTSAKRHAVDGGAQAVRRPAARRGGPRRRGAAPECGAGAWVDRGGRRPVAHEFFRTASRSFTRCTTSR